MAGEYAAAKEKVNLWRVSEHLLFVLRTLQEVDLETREITVVKDLIKEMKPVLELQIESRYGCGYRSAAHAGREAVRYFESLEVVAEPQEVEEQP